MQISASSMLPPGVTSTRSLSSLKGAERTEETATAFEAIFGALLVKEMRKTLPDGLFGSDAADIYGGLFDEHIGQQLAEGDGLGIKQFLLTHMILPENNSDGPQSPHQQAQRTTT